MSYRYPLLLPVLSAAGCGAEGDSPDAAGQGAPIVIDPSTAGSRSVGGEAAYRQYCAGCHESGAGGAPRTGDASAWEDRSPLWAAVLFEHAEEGYLGMPAGGGSTLPDETVDAAAEYMLSITFPDYAPDPNP